MLCKAPKYRLRSDRWPGHRSWWSGWFIMWFSFRSHSRSTKNCTCSELSGDGRTFFYLFFIFYAQSDMTVISGRGWSGETRVPGEIKRSRDLRGGRWSWTLTFAQKRSWVGRWSWAEQVGRLLLRVVQVVHQQRCNGHCLSDTVQHSSWKSNCAVHKSLGNGEGTPP